MGRRKVIDMDKVVELASQGCIIPEIALYCNVSDDTIQRRCRNALKRGWLLRNSSLRKKQVEIALSGNPTMLIWLGKNLLNQTDRQELTGAGGGPIQYERSDLKRLTVEELRQLEELVEKAHAGNGDAG